MPKKTYKLLRFDGGMNNDADPRDIGDNQLQIAENISVSEMGKVFGLDGCMAISHMPDAWADDPSYHLAQSMRPHFSGHGRGFISISTDHGGLLDGTVSYPGETYYLMETSTAGAPTYFSGTCTATSATVCTDSGADYRPDGLPADKLVGGSIINTTDGSQAIITANDATTITVAALLGGNDQTFTSGDGYRVIPPVRFEGGVNSANAGAYHPQGFGITGFSESGTTALYNDVPYVKDPSEIGAISVPYLNHAVMYYVDGALRIADADHSGMPPYGTATPQWRGFIPGKDLMTGTTYSLKTTADQWATQDTHINGAFPTFVYDGTTFCKNAMMGNVVAAGEGYSNGYGFSLEGGIKTVDAAYDGTNDAATTTDANWGFFLEYGESSDGNGSGTWMPTTSTRYKFYITTMYDDNNQESLPQLMRMWDTQQVNSTNGAGLADQEDRTFVGQTVQSEIAFFNDPYNYSILSGDPGGVLPGANFGGTTTQAENIAVHFSPQIKILSEGNEAGAGNYNLGAPTLGSTTANGNARISGYRVYWASNEDGYTSLWQLFDAKFDEGVKVIGLNAAANASGYSPWADAGSDAYCGIDLGGIDNKWVDPPRFIEYDVINGHSATEVINADSYKTAIVTNRRAYIGNVSQDGWIHGDRMLKSPVNQFDKFPSINNIDVAIHDGDEIVLLLEFADRILQFKEKTVYVINVSGNAEYLEGEYRHKGISNAGAACRTDYGIAWANNYGCYFYDGEQVSDLLEDGGMRKITQSSWSDFIGDENYHRIGFDASNNHIAVKSGVAQPDGKNNHAFVYDMITKSWVKSTDFVDEASQFSGTNFITDSITGKLMWVGHSEGHLDLWRVGYSPFHESRPCLFITKDIDFGEPAVRKKIYSVYVTYRYTPVASAESWMSAFAYADGRPTKLYFDYSGRSTNFSNPVGETYGTFDNVSAGEWVQARLRPLNPSEFKNVKSLAIGIETPSGKDTENDFQINDITIVFRQKSVK